MCVMHRCDNPICCNPQHLTEGTLADNCRDCAAKGRTAKGQRNAMSRPEVAAKLAGERNPMARLTREEAVEIRQLREGGVSIADLAARFGVSRALVSLIANGKRWRGT